MSQNNAVKRVEATLHELLQKPSGDTVKIPTKVPFSGLEAEAHTWNNATVLKYFTLKLELPAAFDIVREKNITGLDLLSMSDKYPHPALPDSMHPMHKIKIHTHTESLRQKVIDRAKKNRPDKIEDWDAAHVASWLHIEQGDELAALTSFRGNWTGNSLKEIVKHHGGARGWSALKPEQQQSLLTAITLLIERDIQKASLVDSSAGEKVKGKKSGKKKKKRAATALMGRRTTTNHQDSNRTADDVEGENEEGVVDNDDTLGDLPPPSYDNVAANEKPYVFDRHAPPAPDIVPETTNIVASSKKAKPKKKSTLDLGEENHENRVKELNLNKADESGHESDDAAELLVMKSSKSKSKSSENRLSMEIFSQERTTFLQKIAELQQIVQQHAKQIHHLQDDAHRLQRDKDLALLENAHLQNDHRRIQQLVRKLQDDRDIATKELENMVSLFATHAHQQEQTVSSHIHDLKQQIQDTKKSNQRLKKQQQQQQQSQTAVEDQSEEGKLVKQVNQSSAQVSALIATAQTAQERFSATSLAQAKTGSTEENNGDSDLEDVPPSTGKSSLEMSVTRLPPPIVKPPPSLLVPAPTTPTTTNVPVATPLAPAVGPDSMHSMLDMLTAGATQQLQHWRQLVHHLKLPKDRFTSACLAGDTRQLLLVVVCRWIQLGRALLRHDIHGLLYPGQTKQRSTSTNKHEEQAMLQSVDSLRSCCRTFLDPLHRQYHHHMSSAHSTTGSNKTANTTHSTTTQPDNQNMRITLSLTSNGTPLSSSANAASAVPMSRFGQWQERLRHCTHENAFPEETAMAVALVYCFAALQRHLIRFQDVDSSSTPNNNNTTSANLSQQLAEISVFFQGLQSGTMPPTAISRDNLRDFIAHQLGLELSWEDYDAVAQRIDKDRSGFIHFPELFHAFASLHPTIPMLPTSLAQLAASSNKSTSMMLPQPSQHHHLAETIHMSTSLIMLYFSLFSDHMLSLCIVSTTIAASETSLSEQLVLSQVATPKVQHKGISLGEAWLRIFTQATHSRASATKFKRFLQRLDYLRTKSTQNANTDNADTLLSSSSSTKLLPKKTNADYHKQLVQDQGLVSALLLEGTYTGWELCTRVLRSLPELKKRYFQRVRREQTKATNNLDSTPDRKPTAKKHHPSSVLFSSSSAASTHTSHQQPSVELSQSSVFGDTKDVSAESTHTASVVTAYFTRAILQMVHLATDSFTTRHEELVLLLAHGMNIFTTTTSDDNSMDSDVLSGVANCLAQYWQLRYNTLLYLSQQHPETYTDAFQAYHEKLSLVHAANPHLALQVSASASSTMPVVEDKVSMILGIPLLGTCPPAFAASSPTVLPRLHHYQLYVEMFLQDVRECVEHDKDILLNQQTTGSQSSSSAIATSGANTVKTLLSPPKSPKKSQMSAKATAVLADLQRSLHDELWGTVETGPDSRSSSTNNKITGPTLQVITEVNETLAQQRVEQITTYLDVLNHRATKKKQILSSLLSLWQSAKLRIKEQQFPSIRTQVEDRDRALAMPISDIVAQTRHIQNVLLRDMQRQEPTKMVLLEDRIVQLQEGLAQGLLADETGVLAKLAAEVEAMRASLLQANNDAMRLSARILQHIQPFSSGTK